MKFLFTILLFFNLAISSFGQTCSIDIYDPNIDGCSRYVAETFFYALDNDEFKILSLLVKKGAKIDTNELKKFKRSNCYTYFYLKDNPFCYQRAYFKEEAGKMKKLFNISLLFNENNRFIIDEVKIEEDFNLPKKLKRKFAKASPNLSDKDRLKAILAPFGIQLPTPSSNCECLYAIDWKRDRIILEGDLCGEIESYLGNYECINETGFPVHIISLGIFDSTGVPTWLQRLENLEYLKIVVVDMKSIPEEIGNLKVKNLILCVVRVETPTIPASIGNLEQLEDLVINCKECTELPITLAKLKKMKKFVFVGNKLNRESTFMVYDLGGTIRYID